MWNDRFSATHWWERACFDPGTLMAGTMAMTAAGTAMSASSTIAGGNAAAEAGKMQQNALNFQAAQLRENEGGEIGAAQREMLDTQLKTKQLESTVEARSAAGGVNAAVGSPLAAEKQIASRGTYQSLMDLFNGQNRATGDENEAKGATYSGVIADEAGTMQQRASNLNAMATIAGGGASMMRSYGAFAYPNQFGRPGVGYG